MSVDGGVQSITLIHGPSSLLSPMLLLYDRPLTMPLFPSRISVVLSHHLSLEDRRTDERLSRARNAPFLFFTSGVPREREQSIRVLSFPRGLAGIKLLPRRELMLPAVNSFYFSRWGSFRGGARSNSSHLASLLHSLLTRDFYFNGDSLSRIVPRLLYKG